MPTAAVLLANGFEEIEAITVIDVLRRADIQVLAVGVDADAPTGSHGLQVVADARLDPNARYDALILPGGMPGASTLRDHAGVQALLRAHAAEHRLIGAICAAPIALAAAGLLHGRRATCYPGFEAHLAGAVLSTERVVTDGTLITSRGPATALDFALALAAALVGDAAAHRVRLGLLAA